MFCLLFLKLEIEIVERYHKDEMVKSDRVMLGHEIEKHSRDAVKDDFAPAEREDLFTLQPEGNTTKGKYEYKIGKSFIKIIQSSLDEV